MKVGDLIKWPIVNHDEDPIIQFEYGTIMRILPGEDINGNPVIMDMALILFTDGTRDWIAVKNIEVISES